MIIHTSELAISRLPQVQLDSAFPLRDIVHMVLAGGPSQTLYNLSTGMHQRAVEYLCRDADGAILEDTAVVYATGHCLDAISAVAEFLPDEQEWMQRACCILAQTIEAHWTSVGRNIGPLTHAIHAFRLLDV